MILQNAISHFLIEVLREECMDFWRESAIESTRHETNTANKSNFFKFSKFRLLKVLSSLCAVSLDQCIDSLRFTAGK